MSSSSNSNSSNIDKNDEPPASPAPPETAHHSGAAQQPSQSNFTFNSVTLIGPSRSRCGYCQGSRTEILSVPNPNTPMTTTCTYFSQQQQQQKSSMNHSHEFIPSSSSLQQQGLRVPTQPIVLQTEFSKARKDHDANSNSNNNTCQNRHDHNKKEHKMNTSDDDSYHNEERIYVETDNKNSSSSSSSSNNNNNSNEEEELVTTSTSTKAYSMIASTFNPQDYQKLLDKGWRRSGELLYYPKNWECCCPSHPIRLDVHKFKMNKSQKKVLKNLNCALIGRIGGDGFAQDEEDGIEDSKRSTSSTKNTKVAKKGTKRFRRNDNNIMNEETQNLVEQTQQRQHHHEKEMLHSYIHAHSKEVIDKSGLLCILQNCVIQIVNNHTTHDDDDISKSDLSTKIQNLIKKCSSFKINNMGKQKDIQLLGQQQYQQQDCNNNTKNGTTTITTCQYKIQSSLSTSICAALHGASNGEIDKSSLGQTIVDQLQSFFDIQQQQQKQQQKDASSNVSCNSFASRAASTSSHADDDVDAGIQHKTNLSSHGICIESISFHEKSGHINVSLQLRNSVNCTKKNNNDIVKSDKEVMAGIDLGNMDVDEQSQKQHQHDSNNKTQKPIMENLFIDFIQSLSSSSVIQPPYKLTVKSIPSLTSGRDPRVHRLYTKYQAAVHNDTDPFICEKDNKDDDDLKMTSDTDSEHDDDELFNSNNDVSNATSAATHGHTIEKLQVEDFDKLYGREYNQAQRNKIYKSYSGYYRFLCSTPLPSQKVEVRPELFQSSLSSSITKANDKDTTTSSSTSNIFDITDEDVQLPYGSYHQHYLINDKILIAVGVVDILPSCVSSVYAFYDPVISTHINLGKLTALYEIDWVKHASKFRPNLKYYYLGYYIHSCQKMRYKAEYKPSDVLCPLRGVWVDFESVKKRLEARSPVRHCCDFSTPGKDEKGFKKEEGESHISNSYVNEDNLDCIWLSLSPTSRLITVNMLTREGQDLIRPILREFVLETGFEVARRCIIKLYS